MDDNLSIKSNDSVTISGEYEIVADELDAQANASGASPSPTLKIANNGNHNDLEKNLTEMIYELDVNSTATHAPASPKNVDKLSVDMNLTHETGPSKIESPNKMHIDAEVTTASTKIDTVHQRPQPMEMNKVGQSVFYDCLDLSPMAEKQDDMKPERSDTEEDMSEIDQDGTTFNGVTSLGSSSINAPKSEIEIQRKMSELNSNHTDDSIGLKVSVTIPSCHDGYVVLQDEASNTVIKRYEISRILFYARGPEGSADEACFAFTWQATNTVDSPVFQCHAFRCNIPEAVKQVSSCFAKAFHPIPASLTTSMTSTAADSNVMNASLVSDAGAANTSNSIGYEFIVMLQIREKLNKNTYSAVPRDRSGFKLHCNTDKEITITVNQASLNSAQVLHIERCFGVLMSPGKLMRQADMQLLDMVSMGYVKTMDPASSTTAMPYVVRAEWMASDKNFEQLNQESTKMHITVAIDLVIRAIQEPVRFIIETPITIQMQHEMRLMDHFNFSGGKKSISQRFYLQLKDNGEGNWEVSSIDPSEDIVEPVASNTNSSSILRNFGINSFARMTRSTSAVSIEQDESPVDYSSDGDEPLLSGTGDVPIDCSQDKLDEWDPVIMEWDSEKRPKNLAPLVRMGIPEKFRGNIWQRLANVDNKTDMTDMYRVLLTQETKCETVIQRDIHRTFPAHKFFSEIGGSGQDVLFKVSKAYAVYDTEVGYCQGLSFIAASLLLHMPEEEAFCVLVALMYDYGLRDLYKDGFEILYLHLYQLNRLLKDQLPKLFEHFEQNGIETHMFASQWFLTLFTARFPLYFVFHILDVFLLDGMPILFQVALTLLTEFESELRMLDFEGILKYFRVTLPKRCRSVSLARKLMKKACERKVKKLKHYRDEFLAQKELLQKEEAVMRQYALRFDEERKQLRADIASLRTKLDQTMEKSKQDEERKTIIIDDYKQIIQRHELQIAKLTDKLNAVTETMSKCEKCSSSVTKDAENETESDGNDPPTLKSVSTLGPLDPFENSLKQVKELELMLAQTKLELVEASCRNQDLTHQMNTLIGEIQSNRNSWQPWLTKTINSIQEKVVSAKRDTPSFQSYTSNSPTPSCNSLERNVEATSSCSNSSNATTHSGRNSLNLMKTENKMTSHNHNQ